MRFDLVKADEVFIDRVFRDANIRMELRDRIRRLSIEEQRLLLTWLQREESPRGRQ